MHRLLRHRARVLSVALAIVRDRGLAEDVVQDAFVIAHAKYEQLRDAAAERSWLVAIARNRAKDLMRARRREVLTDEIEVGASNPDEALAEARRAREVREALVKMPARYREVLLAFYGEGRSVRSIATRMGLSEAAVLQRLSRGRKLIAERHGHLRDLAVLVMILFAERRAEAAPRNRAWQWPVVAMLLVGWTDVGTSASPPARSAPELRTYARAVESGPASHSRSSPLASPPDALRARPRSRIHVSGGKRPAPRTALVAPAPAVVADLVDPFSAAAADPADQARPAPPADQAPPAPGALAAHGRVDAWYAIDGWLENAALLRAGESSLDFQGTELVVGRGLTDHVSLRIGFSPLDMRVSPGSTMTRPVALLGVGIKVGAELRTDLHVAAVVEGAREWHSGTLELGDRGLVRAYASLTRGTPRANATINAGVIAIDERQGGMQVVPLLGLALQLDFADHTALVTETQYLTRPVAGFDGSVVLAMRAHREHGSSRLRFDLGTMVTRSRAWPWFQVGLGW